MTDVSRLPGPTAELWEWQLFGSCRDYPSELFFHPEGERGPSRSSREAAAKAICEACPVLRQCAEHALRAREPYGVWGGMSEADRDRILGRGRASLAPTVDTSLARAPEAVRIPSPDPLPSS